MPGRLQIHSLAARAGSPRVVALQTKGKDDGPRQQFGIHGAVRVVAHPAAFHAHGGMLINKRPALVDVTFQAGALIVERLLHHVRTLSHPPSGGEGAVGIVTVAALHETFIHAMFGGHFELSADTGVARIAEIVLLLGEQLLGRGGMVDGVTAGASHVVLGMLGALDIGLIEIFLVTRQAGLHGLLGRHQGKGPWDGGLAAPRRDMRAAGPMATFAAGAVRRFLAGSEGLKVRIPVEVLPDIRVASLANVGPDISSWGDSWRLLRQGDQKRKRQEPCCDGGANHIVKMILPAARRICEFSNILQWFRRIALPGRDLWIDPDEKTLFACGCASRCAILGMATESCVERISRTQVGGRTKWRSRCLLPGRDRWRRTCCFIPNWCPCPCWTSRADASAA